MRKHIMMAALLLAPLTARAEPAPFIFNPQHTQIRFTWEHFANVPFEAMFQTYQEEILFDEDNIENSSINVTVQMDSVFTGLPRFDDDLRQRDWLFDVEKFPTATFRSTNIRRTGEELAELKGILTIKGVSKEVTFDVRLMDREKVPDREAFYYGFIATAHVDRSEFNMDHWVPRIPDNITITIAAELMTKPAPSQ